MEMQLFDAQEGDDVISNRVRDEGEEKDEQRVQRHDPENVLQEDQRAIEAKESEKRDFVDFHKKK